MERTTEGFTSQGGGGEVHSHVSTHASQTDEGIVGTAKDQVDDLADTARERAGELRDRAGEMASDVRNRAGQAFHDAEDLLEERTGVLTAIRSNALPAMGFAFAVGFALAGSSDNKRGVRGFARRRLRTAVRAGIAAALTNELRGMAGGADGMLASLFGQESDSDRGRGGRSAGGSNQRATGGSSARGGTSSGAATGLGGGPSTSGSSGI
jgi:ElaB/YqjD/DUF883 family membrane-anchored ribosome-binding protein